MDNRIVIKTMERDLRRTREKRVRGRPNDSNGIRGPPLAVSLLPSDAYFSNRRKPSYAIYTSASDRLLKRFRGNCKKRSAIAWNRWRGRDRGPQKIEKIHGRSGRKTVLERLTFSRPVSSGLTNRGRDAYEITTLLLSPPACPVFLRTLSRSPRRLFRLVAREKGSSTLYRFLSITSREPRSSCSSGISRAARSSLEFSLSLSLLVYAVCPYHAIPGVYNYPDITFIATS